jgi:hypothetical protein
VNINQYIESGIIEAYTLGLADHEERQEFESLLADHPELQQALFHFEVRVEALAFRHQVPPPASTWHNIMEDIENKDLVKRPPHQHNGNDHGASAGETNYIPAATIPHTHIKVHKYWRWGFIAIFILGKLFLALAIYYYLQYQAAEKEIKKIQQQEQTHK